MYHVIIRSEMNRISYQQLNDSSYAEITETVERKRINAKKDQELN